MSFERMSAVLLRHLYLLRGSPARIIQPFAWVAIDIVLWGFITRYLNTVSGSGFNFVPALLGGVLMWDFFGRVMHGVTLAFFEDVWSRNFLNVFATPLTISEYLGGLILSSVITSAAAMILMLALASALFGLNFFVYGANFIPFVLVLFLFGIAMGIAGTAIVLRLGPSAEWFIWPIPTLLSPFVAVFYPMSTLPGWMQAVGRLLPPSYVFEGMRALVEGRPAPFMELAGGLLLAGVDLALAAWFFRATFRSAVRGGLIARYSAESLN